MSSRAEQLAAGFEGAGIDLMLVTDLVNVRYLTGYTGSNGLVMIGPDTRVFVTDFRYTEQAQHEVGDEFDRITAQSGLVAEAVGLLPERPSRLGYESEHTSVAAFERLEELLPDRVEPVAVGGLVEALRRVKDAGEIDGIAAAAALADAALQALLEGGLAGRTERELALALEHDMRLRGASGPSFDSIVAAGPRGALPHASPREVAIEPGQLVLFDWGAQLDGYCSDCTRTVAVGEPGPEAREAYELVLGAQRVGLEEVRVGAEGRQIDAAVREIIYGAGHEGHYGHALGHGVGLEIHEGPTLSQRSEDVLEAGNVITVEPGIYVPGGYGVRIEDLVVVTTGGIRILTQIPKAMRIVD